MKYFRCIKIYATTNYYTYILLLLYTYFYILYIYKMKILQSIQKEWKIIKLRKMTAIYLTNDINTKVLYIFVYRYLINLML